MENTISVAGIIQSLKTSDFILNCDIPLGYVAGLPIVQVKNNGSLCLVIPYLKYKITGPVDKTLVFPIKYTVTVKLPEERIVQFSDISVTAGYKTLDFSKPVGLFRHDSIKHLSKGEYRAKREELLSFYDKFLNSLAFFACATNITRPLTAGIFKSLASNNNLVNEGLYIKSITPLHFLKFSYLNYNNYFPMLSFVVLDNYFLII